ncbi:hypothetical protein RFI_25448 [Reticulomyxa filosa]|uniref:Uncharacterized protein n=1 Tax=Reticulomyxa filosa TaxID=46433 RepID=X6MD51_RETFI|nr:hypothetical protein RFI_25448 [Reticulomyxa filosa]|eukprot:ETO11928.1 hypothetical protein RFI_25448 [Reticulomyxa filosa]
MNSVRFCEKAFKIESEIVLFYILWKNRLRINYSQFWRKKFQIASHKKNIQEDKNKGKMFQRLIAANRALNNGRLVINANYKQLLMRRFSSHGNKFTEKGTLDGRHAGDGEWFLKFVPTFHVSGALEIPVLTLVGLGCCGSLYVILRQIHYPGHHGLKNFEEKH